jgi:hypothetical protein
VGGDRPGQASGTQEEAWVSAEEAARPRSANVTE